MVLEESPAEVSLKVKTLTPLLLLCNSGSQHWPGEAPIRGKPPEHEVGLGDRRAERGRWMSRYSRLLQFSLNLLQLRLAAVVSDLPKENSGRRIEINHHTKKEFHTFHQ